MVIDISVQYNGGLLPDIIPLTQGYYYHVSGLLLMFFWCPCMAINVNVQYNGGFLPDIMLWTQCYLHRGTCSNAMKRFRICSLLIPPKRFDIFSPITGGCSEGLGVV